MNPTWTILVATLGQRADRFTRLMNQLLPQLRPYAGAVTICALWNNGERSLGEVRQALVEYASSKYVSFVDDDDTLPDDYVSTVMRCLAVDVDYVGWRVQCIMNGVRLNPTYHSLEYAGWSEDRRGYYRDISHLNPIRRDVALRADFRRGQPPEDVSWADQVRALRALRTQCYIDRVMYTYHATHDSTWRPRSVRRGNYVRSAIDDSNFSWHPWSFTWDEVPMFESQRDAWSRPPVDDVGYLSSADLLTRSDDELRALVEAFETSRYAGARNRGNVWRDVLGLDTTRDCRVLDYGCGVGVEALQYAKTGNDVWLADIVSSSVSLAHRVLKLYGYESRGITIGSHWPFIEPEASFDVIHCSGVLHHIPEPRSVIKRFAELLIPGGEVRLMLYSDVAWRVFTGTEPPEDVTSHPRRETFVRRCDDVGTWADWYSRERLEARFGDLLKVKRVEYMMSDRTFLAAVLRRSA